MAACYHCGIPGADYRREVRTGYSHSYGKRSSSTRVNYSTRSLCSDCAASNDLRHYRKSVFFKVFIIIVTIVLL